MLLPGENGPKSWLLLAVFVISIVICINSSEAKSIDINIGFDLTQGKNGPSLHIRDFEDSHEFNPRAKHNSGGSSESSGSGSGGGSASGDMKPIPSNHSGGSGEPLKDESSKEAEKAKSSKEAEKAKSSSGSNSNEDTPTKEPKVKITRGLRPAEFEPEEAHPKIHPKRGSDSNESKGRRRYRRDIRRFYYMKS